MTSARVSSVHIQLKHDGMLAQYGYVHVATLSPARRRAALRKAGAALGWLHLLRRLNVLYIYNKNRHPDLADVFERDRVYASAKYALFKSKKKS